MSPTSDEMCRCGHQRAAHEHYRSGTECSICPDGYCPGFVRQGSLKAKFARPLGEKGPAQT